MHPITKLIGITAVVAMARPEGSLAQLVPSEKAMVAQTIDGTRITVEYSRPRLRGRTDLLGTVEPWGRAWTPGADDATTIEVSRPVTVLGRPLAAGKYSVWLVLRQSGPWTLVLDPRAGLFHTQHPDSTGAQLRVPVDVRAAAHTEALSWSFPVIGITGATLEMRWGTRSVSIPIEVTPTFPLHVAASDAAPLVGEYLLTSENPAPRVTIVTRDGALIARRERAGDAPLEYQLLPIGGDRFVQGEMFRGELWRTNAEWTLHFTRAGGRVTGFEMWRGGRRVGTGERR